MPRKGKKSAKMVAVDEEYDERATRKAIFKDIGILTKEREELSDIRNIHKLEKVVTRVDGRVKSKQIKSMRAGVLDTEAADLASDCLSKSVAGMRSYAAILSVPALVAGFRKHFPSEDGDGLDWSRIGRVSGRLWRSPPMCTFARSAAQRTDLVKQRSTVRKTRLPKGDGPGQKLTLEAENDVEEAEAAGARRHLEIAEQLEDALRQTEVMDLRPTPDNPKRRERRLDLVGALVNPWSFSQTIENLFYFSFLIKEGRALVEIAPSGRPVIYAQKTNQGGLAEIDTASQMALQSILALDQVAWRSLVEKEGLEAPLLRHRGNRDQTAEGLAWCKAHPKELEENKRGGRPAAVGKGKAKGGSRSRRAAASGAGAASSDEDESSADEDEAIEDTDDDGDEDEDEEEEEAKPRKKKRRT